MGNEVELPREGVVLVTDRTPNDELYQALSASTTFGLDTSREDQRDYSTNAAERRTLRIIGDAEAPNIIAQAVFAGHLAAREFDEERVEGTPFRVERVKV